MAKLESSLQLNTSSSSVISSESLISSMVSLFNEIIVQNENLNIKTLTLFDAKETPTISLHDFLIRIAKFTYLIPETLILSLIYVDRMLVKTSDFVLRSRNIHRIIFIAIIIAIKFSEDKYYKNEYYSKVGGVGIKEMNNLEKEFLFMIEFELFVDDKTFRKYEDRIRKLRKY